MAQKSAQPEVILNIEEALDMVDKTMERVKSLYEQYFLGIQKQPPTFIHSDLERKLRDLQQIQIRNTALRYRYATLQQKFGSYNSYWRRTLRQIENGTYVRSLAKIGRKAIESGEDIPEEILAKMPKRMRDQVRRDREAAIALAQRRNQVAPAEGEGDFYDDYAPAPTAAPVPKQDSRGAHLLSEDDGDLDLDAYFREVEQDETTTSGPPPRQEPPMPAAPTPPSGPANLRAASLGGLPRAQSPAVRASTQPGVGSAPTPPSFRPSASQVGRRADTEVESERSSKMTEPDQLVVGAQPLGRPSQPPPNTAQSGSFPRVPQPAVRPTPYPRPSTDPTQPTVPAIPGPSQSGAFPRANPDPTMPNVPAIPRPLGQRPSIPAIPSPSQSGSMPAIPKSPSQSGSFAPSQGVRPNPIAPGSSQQQKQVGVETMSGPFAREPSVAVPPRRSKRDTDVDQLSEATPTAMTAVPQPIAKAPTPQPSRPAAPVPPMRPSPTPPRPSTPLAGSQSRPNMVPRQPTPPAGTPIARPQRPPPGMTDDDVNNLYAKYVKAKEMVGEQTNAQTYGKLLNTINAQAPKIMEQYKAKGVDFSVVVKDNQVIIKAKPKP